MTKHFVHQLVAEIGGTKHLPEIVAQGISAGRIVVEPDHIEISVRPFAPVGAGDAETPTLETFLAGLRTSWKEGEIRPTARSKPVAKRGRRRPDPLVAVTTLLRTWFEAEPWRTARELLEQLQFEQPGDYPDKLLRTLQRRLKIWRAERAHEMVFGPRQQEAPADTEELVP